ncbi:MAG: hypothetical protein K2K21_09550 [Lachnospiraceae bacterium]|nr:hypothetical protein [Lachnospiraceae bacterium]
MNSVIFLDIDGVLNSNFWNDSHQKEISDGKLIDIEKIQLLAKLVRKTNSKIILHSGWRFWYNSNLEPTRKESENLSRLMQQEGLVIDGMTPDFSTEEIRKSKKFSLVKASEILAWLAEHKEIDKWLVIDDLDLHNPEIEIHQIKTDSSIGLTIEDIQKAEKKLLS